MSLLIAILGRILIGVLFVVSGAQKIAAPGSAAIALLGTGFPRWLAIPTGVFEVCAGLLLAAGLGTRIVSIILAVFVAVTIFVFHADFTDPQQGAMALKNIAIVGGLLVVSAYGQMRSEYHDMRADDPLDKRGMWIWWRY